MDSMEVNKAIAAVLVAGIAFFVTGTVGTILVEEHKLEKPAIKIDVPEAAAPSGQPAPAAAAADRPIFWRRLTWQRVKPMRTKSARRAIASTRAAKPAWAQSL